MTMETAAGIGIHIFFTLLGLLPRPLARRLGNALGYIWYRLDWRHRQIALDNLTRAFGHEKSAHEIRTLALRNFKQTGQILFEIGWSLRLDMEKDRRCFTVRGMDHLLRCRRLGKGVLVMTAHVGNWELLALVAAMNRIELNVLYRPLDYPPLNRFVEKTRGRFGIRLIPSSHSMRKILTALGNGGVVAMLMDQNVDWYEGVFADFFGHRACTNKGLALIARKTGAPVIPAFIHRTAGGFGVEIGPEIPFVHTGDKTKDLDINTLRYNQAIEAFICRHPDQWFWVHQRWKTRPYHPWPRQPDAIR